LRYGLSTESLNVGRDLFCALVQVSQNTNKGPSSQEDHQSGEQQGILECIERFGKSLCGQIDVVGDLLESLKGVQRATDVGLYQFMRCGIARMLNGLEHVVEAFHIKALNVLRDLGRHELFSFERVLKMTDIELGQLVCRDIARTLNRFESLVENFDVELLKVFWL
jgi:hypothetical protein